MHAMAPESFDLDEQTPIGTAAELLAPFEEPWEMVAESYDGESVPVTFFLEATDDTATFVDNEFVTRKRGIPLFGYSTNMMLVLCPDHLDVPIRWEVPELDAASTGMLSLNVHDARWDEVQVHAPDQGLYLRWSDDEAPHLSGRSRRCR